MDAARAAGDSVRRPDVLRDVALAAPHQTVGAHPDAGAVRIYSGASLRPELQPRGLRLIEGRSTGEILGRWTAGVGDVEWRKE